MTHTKSVNTLVTLLMIIAPVEKKQQVNEMRKKGEKIEEKEKTKESIAGAYLTS